MPSRLRHLIRFEDNEKASWFSRMYQDILSSVEEKFGVAIVCRGSEIVLTGTRRPVESCAAFLKSLLDYRTEEKLTAKEIERLMEKYSPESEASGALFKERIEVWSSRKKFILPKTEGQLHYVSAMRESDVTICFGPAGTGKTYLAVALAVECLRNEKVSRIILTRPAVEAGEALGFLPGDLKEKLSPYLRPLYDALFEMIEPEKVEAFIEKGIIEIAPLAYMRGRTLNDAFVILDEAQNASSAQMKMFLTRLGFNSKVTVTGDITQIDLAKNIRSGLIEVKDLLKKIEGISVVQLTGKDIIRHRLVQKILDAYKKSEDRHEAQKKH